MLNLLLVEDDEYHLGIYEEHIQSLRNDIHFVLATTGEDALEALQKQKIDGALIDIYLPGISGLALASKIRSMENYRIMQILFVSATDNDQIETYKEYHNFDYIQKPFSEERFREVLLKFIETVEAQQQLTTKKEDFEIVFSHDGGLAHIRFQDLLYAGINTKNKIEIVTEKSIYYRSRVTLKNVITEVGDDMFVQCHKSFAVNVANIEGIKPAEYAFKKRAWDILFRDAPGKTCPLSEKHRKEILERLGEMKQETKGAKYGD